MLLKPGQILALSLTSLLLVHCARNNNNPDAAASTGSESATAAAVAVMSTVKPPFENVNVPLIKHTVQPAAGGVLRFETGTTVQIPANVFVDQQGSPVTTPVEISFREFHNAAEIIAAGIPMSVRHADGHHDWMQTAGMFEIQGTSQGQPVRIADGKSIQVDLASQVDGQYGFWTYDPQAKNWVTAGASNAAPLPSEGNSLENEVKKLRLATATKPVAPIAFDQKKLPLNFDLDVSRYPELRQLKNVVWQYAGNDKKLDPVNNKWIFSKPWDDAKIEPGANENEYILTLISDDTDYTIPVCPTQKGMELKQAQAAYDRMMREYEKNMAILAEREEILNSQADFQRSLYVQGFGLHNCDILWQRNDVVTVNASFDFGQDVPESAKQWITVYLVTAEGRSVVGMTAQNNAYMRFSPSWDNKLVAVLPGNKVAIFTQEDFNRQKDALIQSNEGRYTFRMRVTPQPVQSVADVAAAIRNAG